MPLKAEDVTVAIALDNPITVPGALSFLAFGTFSGEVRGLAEFPEDEWPTNIELLYYAFHVMAGLGTLFIALMTAAAFGIGSCCSMPPLTGTVNSCA